MNICTLSPNESPYWRNGLDYNFRQSKYLVSNNIYRKNIGNYILTGNEVNWVLYVSNNAVVTLPELQVGYTVGIQPQTAGGTFGLIAQNCLFSGKPGTSGLTTNWSYAWCTHLGNGKWEIWGEGRVIIYIFDDQFTINQAPPLAGTRTTQPGGQDVTIVDSNNILSITGGTLEFPADPLVTTTDPYYESVVAYSNNQPGRAFGITCTPIAPSNPNMRIVGLVTGVIYTGFGATFLSDTDNNQPIVNTPLNQTQSFICLKRGEGGWLFIGNHSGNWQLLILAPTNALGMGNSGKVKINPTFNGFANVNFDSLRVIDLPAPFNTNYGICSTAQTGVITTQSFTHSADCFLDIRFDTLPTASDFEIRFRQQDVNNYWAVITTATDYELWEVVAGTPVQRGTTPISARVQLLIGMYGTRIVIWSATTAYSGRRITYTSASNFATATNGSIATLGDSVVDIFAIFPSDLSQYTNDLNLLI